VTKVNPGDSEFGGGPGMILPQNYDQLADVEWLWTLKATNPDDPESQMDPARVGKPKSTDGVQ
jgi:hypothetical protein